MIIDKCYICGSSKLRADRALSGRLVCASCGNLYGERKTGRNKQNFLNNFSFNSRYLIFLAMFIFAFVLVII